MYVVTGLQSDHCMHAIHDCVDYSPMPWTVGLMFIRSEFFLVLVLVCGGVWFLQHLLSASVLWLLASVEQCGLVIELKLTGSVPTPSLCHCICRLLH